MPPKSYFGGIFYKIKFFARCLEKLHLYHRVYSIIGIRNRYAIVEHRLRHAIDLHERYFNWNTSDFLLNFLKSPAAGCPLNGM